jgi:hypothetical protein
LGTLGQEPWEPFLMGKVFPSQLPYHFSRREVLSNSDAVPNPHSMPTSNFMKLPFLVYFSTVDSNDNMFLKFDRSKCILFSILHMYMREHVLNWPPVYNGCISSSWKWWQTNFGNTVFVCSQCVHTCSHEVPNLFLTTFQISPLLFIPYCFGHGSTSRYIPCKRGTKGKHDNACFYFGGGNPKSP